MKRSTKEALLTALMVLGFTMTLAIASGCGKHIDGEQGAPGVAGAKGDKGDVGSTGPAGADGTVITVVKLCPGATVYPAVFVEIAMCINNKLYGVYSANGGFMVELPPGNYSSNGIGSACNLTVYSDCVVVSH